MIAHLLVLPYWNDGIISGFCDNGYFVNTFLVASDMFSNTWRRTFFRYSSGRNHPVVVLPAPGSEDTELGVLMEPEVDHGETEVYTRVQA